MTRCQAPGWTLAHGSGLWNPPESHPVHTVLHTDFVNQPHPPLCSRLTHRPSQLDSLDSRYKEAGVGGKKMPLNVDGHPLI